MHSNSPAHKFVTLHSAAFESLETTTAFPFTLEGRELSKALFCDLARIKYAAWRHRAKFSRGKSHSVSEIFQDLLAYYLRCALDPALFAVVLEEHRRDEKCRSDIIVKRKVAGNEFKASFVIEVKTTTGFAPLSSDEARVKAVARLKQVAKAYRVFEHNVIYVYQEPRNNGKGVELMYWNSQQMQAPENFSRASLPPPFDRMYPLFDRTDPVQWESRWKHEKFVPDVPQSRFLEEASRRIVTPLEEIIPLIEAAEPAPE
ncbi:hypothetical protein CR51_36035 [Caballeronia megalochromosomata]|nr:hypothetical protein CR51_36035 [Caballeronia megalochromosomata]